jgi:lipid II isoglutaminyl synthase (glutamine-hydrolysing)
MIQHVFLFIVVVCANIISSLSRLLGKGSGTALPGYFVEKYSPWLLEPLLKNYEEIIVITGTNGKTTTRTILSHIYKSLGKSVVTNSGGANIIRGIASTLLQDKSLFGKAKHKIAILEVEEASLPILTKYCKLNTLILTNIFRDQLDAYGEIDTTLGFFTTAITQGMPTRIIANTDDKKLLSSIPSAYQNRLEGFAVTDPTADLPTYESIELSSNIYPNTFVNAEKMSTTQTQTHISIDTPGARLEATISLLGVYNVYNTLAAIMASYPQFGNSALSVLASYKPAFGRGESIHINNASIQLMLIKNPAGFEQVLDVIHTSNQNKPVSVAILINDNTADGKDVSWLWDANVEQFVKNQAIHWVRTGGTRGLDMLIRLKYSGIENPQKSWYKETVQDLVSDTVAHTGTVYILATYTALLSVRKELGKYIKLDDISTSGN